MARANVRGLRWWMIGLVMLGAIINYLTRSTLAVAAPTLLEDLRITAQRVLLDRRHLPGRDHAAAGLRLRAGRARPQARPGDLRHGVVAHQHGARAGAQLADVRRAARPAGLRRRLGEPGRHEGDRGVVPGAGSAASPAASTTSAPRSGRCSRRRWWPGRSSPTTGRRRSSSPAGSAWSGSCLWLWLYQPPDTPSAAVRRGARTTSRRARRRTCATTAARPSICTHRAPAQLLGHRPAALPGRPDLGHADVLGAALPERRCGTST